MVVLLLAPIPKILVLLELSTLEILPQLGQLVALTLGPQQREHQEQQEHQEHQEEYQVQEISGRHEDLPGTTLPRHDLPFPLDRAAAGFVNQFVSETLLEVQKLIPHATQDLVEELTRVILVCLIILYP